MNLDYLLAGLYKDSNIIIMDQKDNSIEKIYSGPLNCCPGNGIGYEVQKFEKVILDNITYYLITISKI